MRIVDDCIAPRRHFDDIVFTWPLPGVIKHRYQAHHARIERVYPLRICKRGKCLFHFFGAVDIEANLGPLNRHILQLGYGLIAITGFDREQLEIRLFIRVVEYFRGAHRRAADIRGQEALFEAGKKQRVN